MPHIVLTEEQVRVLQSAEQSLEVRDPRGNTLGFVSKYPDLTPAEIAELKRIAATEPRSSSSQVFVRLRALQAEWQRTGGFGEEYLERYLNELRAKDGQ